MAETKLGAPTLYAELEPDSGPGENHPRPETVEAGAGFLVVGVEVNGVKVPIFRRKAGKFLQRLEEAKKG